MENPKLLHIWEISLDQTVDETTTETRDGQPVTITKKVTKPVATRMALKQPARRELRDAELFGAARISFYVNKGLLLSSVLTNKLLNLTGGVLSENEKSRLEQLRAKSAELEMDMARSINSSEEDKAKLRSDLASIRTELVNLNSINQSVYSQTAEAKAQNDLNSWIIYTLTLIERGGKWASYFEGDTFEAKEEFMWKLEDAKDEFYGRAAEKIATYAHFFNLGARTPEDFKAIEDELKRQLEASKVKEKTPEAPAAPAVPVEAAPATVEPPKENAP